MLSWFDPFLHSMEVAGSLVVQVMVAEWPTVRGLSRPVILTPDVDFKRGDRQRENNHTNKCIYIEPHQQPLVQLSQTPGH